MEIMVHTFTLWDEDIDKIKREFSYWKEKEPEAAGTISFTDVMTIPDHCEVDAGRKICLAIHKGDDQLYRRIMSICGIKFK